MYTIYMRGMHLPLHSWLAEAFGSLLLQAIIQLLPLNTTLDFAVKR